MHPALTVGALRAQQAGGGTENIQILEGMIFLSVGTARKPNALLDTKLTFYLIPTWNF